jgi:hypothetical protein
MKSLASIKKYNSFSFKANITPRSPESGFDLCFGTTGSSGVFATGSRFYGRSGLVFDQSGNFFGGYYSGRSLEIEGHFFGDRLSYFYNGVLVNNNASVQSSFDSVEFDKFGDSTLYLELNYISGLVPEVAEEGIQDINGIFLISRDNFYILPNI